MKTSEEIENHMTSFIGPGLSCNIYMGSCIEDGKVCGDKYLIVSIAFACYQGIIEEAYGHSRLVVATGEEEE